MIKFKIKNKYGNELLKSIGYLLIGSLFISTIEYFEIFPTLIIAFLKVSLVVFIITKASYGLIERTTQKGWQSGLKMSLIFITILLVINFIILNIGFNYKLILYILLITLASVLGAMIGVLKKQEIN